MKDEWYNNSAEEQKILALTDDVYESEERLHNMLVSQVIRLDKKVDANEKYAYDKISKLEKEIEMLKNKSLISIIKDSFNKWFFGTKG